MKYLMISLVLLSGCATTSKTPCLDMMTELYKQNKDPVSNEQIRQYCIQHNERYINRR